MIVEFELPQLEDGAGEVTVVEWHKAVGDTVTAGEALLDVMTEKVNLEVECSVTGTIVEIVAAPDAAIVSGDVIAKIEVES